MDWKVQTEEMVGKWTDMQKKMWDNWLEAVKGFGKNQATEIWQADYKKNLNAWEDSVRKALDQQVEWTNKWAEKVNCENGTPEVVTKWANQVQDMMKGWTEAQTQLWGAWFESVKSLDPAQIASNWDTEGQQVLIAWQEAAQRAQEALSEWSKAGSEIIKNTADGKK
ncbi:MAG: hypothetical protein D6B27_05215 [Gammaproteobacteria bacterium]|nr:MAG: hypothetical protein D6B27_05215 [Gammaproteobacteria bacterium]